uniref:Uncharacterized protein n=1 Tax=Anguilla anguilla TaxID=7936 RepID=A0A0E9PDT1_ANGAN
MCQSIVFGSRVNCNACIGSLWDYTTYNPIILNYDIFC